MIARAQDQGKCRAGFALIYRQILEASPRDAGGPASLPSPSVASEAADAVALESGGDYRGTARLEGRCRVKVAGHES